ncbi:hypothetical protein AB0F11_27795 [Streptomyces sp. NPDC032472]|uniref:hypothetical protein n=1 Tax=Streptomyces sp. NPDC032472 TaxID=3155018 RepID=UPI0033E00F37
MTEHERPKGGLRVGDRVRFEGQVHTVVGLSGTTVRLVDEHNMRMSCPVQVMSAPKARRSATWVSRWG